MFYTSCRDSCSWQMKYTWRSTDTRLCRVAWKCVSPAAPCSWTWPRSPRTQSPAPCRPSPPPHAWWSGTTSTGPGSRSCHTLGTGTRSPLSIKSHYYSNIDPTVHIIMGFLICQDRQRKSNIDYPCNCSTLDIALSTLLSLQLGAHRLSMGFLHTTDHQIYHKYEC